MYVGITHLGIVTFQGNKRTHQFKWYELGDDVLCVYYELGDVDLSSVLNTVDLVSVRNVTLLISSHYESVHTSITITSNIIHFCAFRSSIVRLGFEGKHFIVSTAVSEVCMLHCAGVQ